MKNKILAIFCMVTILGTIVSCKTTSSSKLPELNFTEPQEAAWIINGEPIEYEGKKWYPQDGIEILTDEEVYLLGTYRDVMFFAEKTDVRPYRRIYTQFGPNKFRYFKL